MGTTLVLVLLCGTWLFFSVGIGIWYLWYTKRETKAVVNSVSSSTSNVVVKSPKVTGTTGPTGSAGPTVTVPVDQTKARWARLPDSWCAEIVMVRKNDKGDLQCEQSSDGGCQWQTNENAKNPNKNPIWRTIDPKEIATGGAGGFLAAWYYANGKDCKPYCPSQGMDKYFHDGPGEGCLFPNPYEPPAL